MIYITKLLVIDQNGEIFLTGSKSVDLTNCQVLLSIGKAEFGKGRLKGGSASSSYYVFTEYKQIGSLAYTHKGYSERTVKDCIETGLNYLLGFQGFKALKSI